jgi:hypothetical protein
VTLAVQRVIAAWIVLRLIGIYHGRLRIWGVMTLQIRKFTTGISTLAVQRAKLKAASLLVR